jgi:hypothetical protein
MYRQNESFDPIYYNLIVNIKYIINFKKWPNLKLIEMLNIRLRYIKWKMV